MRPLLPGVAEHQRIGVDRVADELHRDLLGVERADEARRRRWRAPRSRSWRPGTATPGSSRRPRSDVPWVFRPWCGRAASPILSNVASRRRWRRRRSPRSACAVSTFGSSWIGIADRAARSGAVRLQVAPPFAPGRPCRARDDPLPSRCGPCRAAGRWSPRRCRRRRRRRSPRPLGHRQRRLAG